MKECPACRRCFPDEINHCPQDGDATTPSLLGEPVLDARYQLEKRLGQGGMGVVFKARHIFLKTAHAIKVILPDLVGNDPMLITRFRQEALAAAAIRHQNIIAVTDFGVVRGNTPFLVMEFVNGRSLQDIMAEAGPMPAERAVELISAIGAGVAAAHKQKIVHRDLKPLNIMVENDVPAAEGVKILDFGLAKIKSGELLGSFIQAKTSGFMGSPYYMAPEQWSDEEPDNRADIYSLGVILYQMLAGDVPFKGSSIPSIMKKHLTLPPPSFQSMGVQVSPRIEAVVRHALEKESATRIPSVAEFLNQLKEALDSFGQTRAVSRETGTLDPNKTIASPPMTTGSGQAVLDQTNYSRVSTDPKIGALTSVSQEERPRLESEAAGEAERLEQERAAQLEREAGRREEDQAVEAAAKAERLEQERAAQAEAKRREEEQAAQAAAEAERLEQEQAAQAEAKRREAERVAQAAADAERLEQERAAQAEAARRKKEAEDRVKKEQQEREALERQQREQLERVSRQANELEERLARLATSVPPQSTVIDDEATHVSFEVPPQSIADQNVIKAPHIPPSDQRPFPAVGPQPGMRVLLLVAAGVIVLFIAGGGIGGYLWYSRSATPDDPTPVESPTPPPSNPIKAELIEIPGGTFEMGRNDGPPQERPAHVATVQTFYMDRTEVTNEQYEEFVRDMNYEAPSHWLRGKPLALQEKWPVVNVSARDAEAFAEWRSRRDGVFYRLPTEEEWEYAARSGGSFKLFPWGEEWTQNKAVMKEAETKPVGSRPDGANRWGVVDLIGNVWEWTSSKASLYPGNIAGEINEATKDWVVARGGSYSSDPNDRQIPVSAAYRDWFDPGLKHPNFGFRLIRPAQ